MTFRIHFTVNEVEDYFTISGKTVEKVQEMVSAWFTSRGLLMPDVSPWSEEVSDDL